MSLHDPQKIGALYRKLKDCGAKISAPPFEVAWEKDLYPLDVDDVDGNVLVFWSEKPE